MGFRAVQAALVLVIVALTGCTSPANVVLATGEFRDAAGTSSGSVTLSRLPDGSTTAVLSDVTAPGSDLLLFTDDDAIDPDQTCLESATQIPGPAYVPGQEDTFVLDPATVTPTLIAAFVIARETGAESGCLVEIVANANLTWN